MQEPAPLSSPYRTAGVVPDEEAAYTEFGRRTRRLRRGLAIAGIVGAFGGAIVGTIFTTEVLWELPGMHPFGTGWSGLAGFAMLAPSFIGGLLAARAVGMALIRRRARLWLTALAEEHHVPRERLEEAMRLFT